jgi:4-amino-4-deoxy-L-arabinose transferase-like glycosyltransferase
MAGATGEQRFWHLAARLPDRARLILAPLLAALVVISLQAFRKPLRQPTLDEFYYLTIARDLALHGVFTDGTFKRGPFGTAPGPASFRDESAEWARPGRFFAPAYPILAYLVGRLDPSLAAAIRCHVAHAELPKPPGTCPNGFGSLVAVNILLWSAALLAVFHMALVLGRSETMAWLALVIALATGEAGFYARTYLSETATVPAFCLFMLFAMKAVESGRRRFYALAGVALGAASLARPAYAYLFYALAPALLLLALFARRRWPSLPSAAAALVFAAATLATLAPWMLRNLARFGDPTLSRGYAEVILMQRLAYNQMSAAEWLVAWIYWLPDFGDEIAKLLFPPRLYELLGWTHSANYYVDGGSGAFRARILREAGSEAAVLGLLMKSYLLGDLPRHVMVTLPLTMRGLGVAKYLSVAGWIVMWPVMRELAARGRLHLFLALLLPPLLMAGLHGFVSINIERYNLPMLAVYAVVVAVAIRQAWRCFGPGRA